jgi:hypothetical protein
MVRRARVQSPQKGAAGAHHLGQVPVVERTDVHELDEAHDVAGALEALGEPTSDIEVVGGLRLVSSF